MYKTPVLSAFTLIAIAVLSGCTTIYSQIKGNFDMPTTELNDYPIQIVAVDGQYQVMNDARLLPGTHTLVATSRKPSIYRVPRQKVWPITVEPCTRYYFAARHAGRLTEDWDLIVRRTEPIGGCDAQGALAAAKAEATSVSPAKPAGAA
jgi:uncharacterized protein YceK